MTVTPERLNDSEFLKKMTVGILVTVLYMVLLTSVTWVWFVASVPPRVDRTSHEIAVCVTDSNGDELMSDEGKYSFLGGESYKVTVTAHGNAPAAYCIFEYKGKEYRSTPIPTSPRISDDGLIPSSISFNVVFEESTKVTVRSRAGDFDGSEYLFENGRDYTVSEDD